MDARGEPGHDGGVSGANFGRQRAHGRIALVVEARGGASRVMRVHESGASRLRLPKSPHGLDGVMLNVAGGIACGDAMSVEVEVGEGAAASLSTPGAERVYRSDGLSATVENRLSVAAGGRLSWLPQETILFDHARLERRLEADVAETGRLTVCEPIVFGRRARGEAVRSGLIEDRWRVRRSQKLVFAETLRLSGDIEELLARRAVGRGATALATVLHVAPDADALVDPVRASVAPHEAVETGVSAWNGMLILRMLSPSAERLRDALREALPILIDRPLPRVWTC